MESKSCQCDHSCYLTEHGRQSWMRENEDGSRMKLNHGLIEMDMDPRWRHRSNSWRTWWSWLRVNRSVLVVMVMLLLTITMPLLWHWKISQDGEAENFNEEDYIAEAKLSRIIRSLNDINGNSQSLVMKNNGTSQFPWLQQNNSLPNYFLVERTDTDDLYQSSPSVFLHQHRSAGDVIVKCLNEIANQSHFGKVPNWDSNSREMLDIKLQHKNEYQRLKLQTGQFAMGLCDIYKDRKCSYFSVFREPMDRAVSSYHYCRTQNTQRADEMCSVLNANDVTLRDWILFQGSTTFQQLVFRVPWCQNLIPAQNYSLEGSAVRVAPSVEWPCWFKNRIHLEKLPTSEYSKMLEYILDNLDKWFGVIGLVDDWDSTISIFEHVYKLPLRLCSALSRSPDDANRRNGNRANQKPRKDGYYDDNDPDYLKYDYFVRKTLDADFKIYKKARQIFNIQRQMVLNKISR